MSTAHVDLGYDDQNVTDKLTGQFVHVGSMSDVSNLTMDRSGSADYVMPPAVASDYGLMQLQLNVRRLHLYYIPCVYCLTLLGNAFGIGVLTDASLRSLSSTQYLIGILSMEVVQSLARFHQWFEDNGWQTGLYDVGGWCQFATFTSHIARFLCTWYTVLVGVDCYVAHHVPILNGTLCKDWVAKSVLVAAGIIAIVVYFNISILYGTVVVGPRLVCTQLQVFKAVHQRLDYGDVVFNAAMPTSLILTLIVALTAKTYCCHLPAADTKPPEVADQLLASRPDGSARQSRKGQGGRPCVPFTLCFLVVHCSLVLPIDIYRCVQVFKQLLLPASQLASLEQFLVEQILQFVRLTKCASNLAVLLAAYPLFRAACGRLTDRIRAACRRRRRASRQRDGLEV